MADNQSAAVTRPQADARRAAIRAARLQIEAEIELDPLARNDGLNADSVARVLSAYEAVRPDGGVTV